MSEIDKFDRFTYVFSFLQHIKTISLGMLSAGILFALFYFLNGGEKPKQGLLLWFFLFGIVRILFRKKSRRDNIVPRAYRYVRDHVSLLVARRFFFHLFVRRQNGGHRRPWLYRRGMYLSRPLQKDAQNAERRIVGSH